jgi:hypothetical protein
MKKISAPHFAAAAAPLGADELEAAAGGFWQAAAGFVGGEAMNLASGGSLPEPGSGINTVEDTVEGWLGEKKNTDRDRTGLRYQA